jgi:hypothetical protein
MIIALQLLQIFALENYVKKSMKAHHQKASISRIFALLTSRFEAKLAKILRKTLKCGCFEEL